MTKFTLDKGHYISGRNKEEYRAPIMFEPMAVESVSHKKILKYFKVVYFVVKQLDNYLHSNFIGSYDVIKLYYLRLDDHTINKNDAYGLRKFMGRNNMRTVGKKYYEELIKYCDTL